ncbi:MAG: hypothetical protein JWL98_350 [Xanthomonadaceae bacterium]|nr:hypothetical protein [Xanthomonadaceae bacterium]
MQNQLNDSRDGSSTALPARKMYATPKLIAYGALRDLTTGGSGVAQEHSLGKHKRS